MRATYHNQAKIDWSDPIFPTSTVGIMRHGRSVLGFIGSESDLHSRIFLKLSLFSFGFLAKIENRLAFNQKWESSLTKWRPLGLLRDVERLGNRQDMNFGGLL